MTVDDFLNANFMGDDDNEEAGEDNLDEDDNSSFGSVDDLEDDDATSHMVDLKTLATKDPEFYKFLQENDKELLEFKGQIEEDNDEDAGMDLDGEEEDDDEAEVEDSPVLTLVLLKQWQSSLLHRRSLRALRKLLVAFRSAAHMNEENVGDGWTIDNPKGKCLNANEVSNLF